MSSWRKNIGAITLFVQDTGRSKSFYRKVFELEPGFEEDTDVMFRLENTLLFLTKSSEAPRLIAPAAAGSNADLGALSRMIASKPAMAPARAADRADRRLPMSARPRWPVAAITAR